MTTPTPEETAQWRKKFESRYKSSQIKLYNGTYSDFDMRKAWGSYVAAREDALAEMLDVMKLARFGAEVIYEARSHTDDLAIYHGLLTFDGNEYVLTPAVQATIEQLLKEEK